MNIDGGGRSKRPPPSFSLDQPRGKEFHVGVRSFRRFVPLFALLVVAVSVVSADAFGHGAAAPAVVGNAVAGKAAFTSAGCGSCHTLAAAKAKGLIGPSLDAETLPEAKIVAQITNGGYAVMGIAAKKTYPFPMSAFKGKLTTTQIQNIAAFVFSKRTGKVVATTTTTTSTSSSGGAATTTTAQPGSAPATSPTVNNGCPAGVTIPTSGATDNDTDENGDVSDNDGCI
jgi:mono/diheme cytochrome c family protein